MEGYAALRGINGITYLETFGIKPQNLTDYIIVLDALCAGCFLLAFATLYARLPRPRPLRRAWPGAAAPGLK